MSNKSRFIACLGLLPMLSQAQVIPNDLREQPASKLPGNLQNAPLPALTVSTNSPRAIPVLVNANNSLPVVDTQITVTGGAAPVKLTIAGGPGSNLFQIVEPPPSQLTKVPSEIDEAAAELSARMNPKPAGITTRTLRFLGAARGAGLPGAIPVQVRATDVLGATVNMVVTAYPFAPRIAPIQQPRTALENWTVPFALQGLGAATEIRVDGVSNDCGFRQNPNVSFPSAVAVSAGNASFSRQGTFRTFAPSCNSLRLSVGVKFPEMKTHTAPLVLAVPTFNFRAPQVYNFSSTGALKDFFGFSVVGSHGSCAGDSLGPNGSFPVGVIEKSGDLAFAIRSGPLGTECEFVAKARRLPDGFALTQLRFSKAEGANDSPTNVQMAEPRHYCSIGGSGGTVGGISFKFTRGANVLVGGSDMFDDNGPTLTNFVVSGFERPLLRDGVILLDSGDTAFASVLVPMYLRLRCVITPSNSEHITIRLDSAQFIGPPGVTFP